MAIDTKQFESMEYRSIGPHRGGRVVAVCGVVQDRDVYYMGTTGGGVWKSDDAGTSWHNVSDGYFKWASVGALQVAPSDPNVIYVGMGETTIRGNVSRGDGVYKSTDAGKSWQHMGLEATRNIGEIAIHPTNPRYRLRRGIWPRLRRESGSWALPLDRRRRELGAGSLRLRQGWRQRDHDGPEQPAHPLRELVGSGAWSLLHVLGRRGQQALPLLRRRRQLGGHQPEEGPSRRRCLRQGRAGGIRSPARPSLGAGRARGRRGLPLR